MIERYPHAARQWIDEIDGREHVALKAEMAPIRSPIQAETVDQFRMFEIADLLLVIIQVRSGLLRNHVDPKVGVAEKSIGR